jgi:hypothetical protein
MFRGILERRITMEPIVESTPKIQEEPMSIERTIKQTARLLEFVETVVGECSPGFSELELERTALAADRIARQCRLIVDRRKGK